MKSISQLILIVTHRCNLECRYCNIKKDKISMSPDIAVKAVSVFLKKYSCITPRIKFFGGEPFLQFPLIKKVIAIAKKKSKKLRFEITTNGSILNKGTLDFLSDNDDIELWYSPHSTFIKRCDLLLKKLPNCGINILITPLKVKSFSEEFALFLRLGFRKFNFLPAYFNSWRKEDLDILENEFRIVAHYIKKLIKLGNKIEIKNIKTLSPTPLFNNGFVVDCNGEVFLNNLILSKHFAHLRPDLKVGDIRQADKIAWHRRTDFDLLFKKHLSPGIYDATLNADRILTDFVTLLSE